MYTAAFPLFFLFFISLDKNFKSSPTFALYTLVPLPCSISECNNSRALIVPLQSDTPGIAPTCR